MLFIIVYYCVDFKLFLTYNIFKDYNIFIDSFSGFTSQQLKVLKLLIPDSSCTCVALTLDPLTDGREEVFATSQATYKTLKNIAKKDPRTEIRES